MFNLSGFLFLFVSEYLLSLAAALMNLRSAPPTTERFPDNLEIGEWKVAKGKAISKSIIEECPFLGGISGVHTWKNLNVEQKVSKYDWIRVKRNTST